MDQTHTKVPLERQAAKPSLGAARVELAGPPQKMPFTPLGAHYLGHGRCSFCVWAPKSSQVSVVLTDPQAEREIQLRSGADDYFIGVVEDVEPGTPYLYRLDGNERLPDPASRFQPDSVHGPSEIVDKNFAWSDQHWRGLSLDNYILYEVHVGTASFEGTFDALIPRLRSLKQLGVTALEIMPVAQFAGKHNWGYDGVYPFAVQNSYGGPSGLKRLVNACHSEGLAIVLDVVYNHLGPEGNYLAKYGHYFTDFYRTPWGAAINFDGEHSDYVRRYFIESAIMWQQEYHLDGLRLDAIHAIRDFSAVPFLQEVARATHKMGQNTGRKFYLIAESDLNDARILRTEMVGGYGLDAQWADDLHHVLHTLLTGEKEGYYSDYQGGVAQLAKAMNEGYVYTGQHSRYRRRCHGNSPLLTDPRQFVVCSQNHDQVGNRCAGDRLTSLVGQEKLKLAAGVVILSPFIPMLFMGEEYGEPAPFQYFVDHSDATLREAVSKGRRKEFAAFAWEVETPDPCAQATFDRSRLDYRLSEQAGRHANLRAFYQELIGLRKTCGFLPAKSREHISATPHESENCLEIAYRHRSGSRQRLLVVFNFDDSPHVVRLHTRGEFVQILDSTDKRWGGNSQGPRHQKISGRTELAATSFQVFTGQ